MGGLGICFWVGWGGVGRMLTFVALAHILNATQHDVSSTCTHLECYATWCFFHLHISRCYATDVGGLGVWQMTYWNIKHFLIKRNFFDKNEKTEFRKILADKFAFTNLIYKGHHFKWQCIISKTKLNTCAAIEGRCTLVVRCTLLLLFSFSRPKIPRSFGKHLQHWESSLHCAPRGRWARRLQSGGSFPIVCLFLNGT